MKLSLLAIFEGRQPLDPRFFVKFGVKIFHKEVSVGSDN